MHRDFIQKVGRGDSEIQKAHTIPTHLKTQALLKNNATIKEIADNRGMTKATIISHLEKLKEVGESDVFQYLRPKDSVLLVIEKAFIKSGDTKLAPVHRILKGKYTYEQLRLARLFIKI